MKPEMATRNIADIKIEKDGCTDFVLHKSQQSLFNGIQKKIVDYTEHRLLRYTSIVHDPQQKLVLMAMISDYREGKIAVAWKQGMPVYLKIQKDSPTPSQKSSG